MSDYLKIASVAAIPKGEMRTFAVEGKKIVLANVDGTFFAFDDTCPHAGCSLGDLGKLAGEVVTCGCHGAKFDVASGKVLASPAKTDINIYPTKVEGGEVSIKV